MLRTFFTIDFRFLGNFGPDLEKSLVSLLPSRKHDTAVLSLHRLVEEECASVLCVSVFEKKRK